MLRKTNQTRVTLGRVSKSPSESRVGLVTWREFRGGNGAASRRRADAGPDFPVTTGIVVRLPAESHRVGRDLTLRPALSPRTRRLPDHRPRVGPRSRRVTSGSASTPAPTVTWTFLVGPPAPRCGGDGTSAAGGRAVRRAKAVRPAQGVRPAGRTAVGTWPLGACGLPGRQGRRDPWHRRVRMLHDHVSGLLRILEAAPEHTGGGTPARSRRRPSRRSPMSTPAAG
jgi:hypothetical protein